MRRLSIVLSALMLVAAACGGDDEPALPSSSTPHVATTLPASTTATASTAPSTTSTTTLSPAGLPPMLIADAHGIRLSAEGEPSTVFLEGEPVALAVPDLRGGVVFQGPAHEIIGMHHDAALGRNVYEWSPEGPEPIWLIAAPGQPPVPVVAHEDAQLELVDVVELGGEPHILYRMMIGGPSGESAWLQILEWLCLYNLETGDSEFVGPIGSYESSYTELRFGGSLVAIGFEPYGDAEGTQVGFMSLDRLGDQAEYNWLPRIVVEHLAYGPAFCDGEQRCYGWAHVTAASDGSRLVWVQGGMDWGSEGAVDHLATEVVAVDRATGDETLRLQIGEVPSGSEPRPRPRYVDDDGSNIIVSGIGDAGEIVVISREAVVYVGEPGATASLWQEKIDTFTDPLEKATPLVLIGDNLGFVEFGDPADEVVELVSEAIGPQSRDGFDMYHFVAWDNFGLTLLFSTEDFYRDDGVEHFVGWGHWGVGLVSPLRTSQGIGIGDTIDELLTAHGDQVTYPERADDCMPAWYVWLNDPSAELTRRMLVVLDGPDSAGTSRVVYMSAGAGYGC